MTKSVFGMRVHEHCRGYWVLRRTEDEKDGRDWLLEYHSKSTNGYWGTQIRTGELSAWWCGHFYPDKKEVPKIVKRKVAKTHRKYLELVTHLNTGKF